MTWRGPIAWRIKGNLTLPFRRQPVVRDGNQQRSIASSIRPAYDGALITCGRWNALHSPKALAVVAIVKHGQVGPTAAGDGQIFPAIAVKIEPADSGA